MALIVAMKKGDISSWRGTTELMDEVRRCIAEGTAAFADGERAELLSDLREEISVEIDFDESLDDRLGELLSAVDAADSTDHLRPLPRRCDQLVVEHFERRGSVGAVQEICTRFFDRVSGKIAELALSAQGTAGGSPGILPWCLMATGEAGRGEMTRISGHRLFLVYDERPPHAVARFREVGSRVVRALDELGILSEAGNDRDGHPIWCGSTGEWQSWLEKAFTLQEQHAVLPSLPALAAPFRHADQEGAGFFDDLAAVADLRLLTGDAQTGTTALSLARGALGRLPGEAGFAQAARRIASMPVALNLFGWFRVERSGKHRGELDVAAHALNPLVTNVRLLAVVHRVAATSTIERVRALLAGGYLNVESAEKVVRAYHEIARRKVRMEAGNRHDDGLFLNPEELSDSDEQKFKAALEAVLGLERLVHSQFTEKM